MDKLKIESSFMKSIVSKLIEVAIKKSVGCNVNLRLGELDVVSVDDEIHIALSASASLKHSEFEKIVKGLL
jgi:hypothetical protein